MIRAFLALLLYVSAFAADTPPKKVPQIKWDAVPGATRYVIQISRDKSFEHPFVDEETLTNLFDWKTVEPGEFWWRVGVADPDGQVSEYGQAGTLKIKSKAEAAAAEQAKAQLEYSQKKSKKVRMERAFIVPPKPGEPVIQGLFWVNPNPSVRVETFDTETQFIVRLEGKFTRPGWQLFSGKKKIELNEQGEFALEEQISRQILVVEFLAVGPEGQTEKQSVALLFNDWEEKKIMQLGAPIQRTFLIPALGVSMISYSETGVKDYSAIALTARMSVNYLLFPPKVDLGFSSYMTALTLSSSQPVNVRFFGFNARVGYILPQFRHPWRVGVYGGLYYTTMIVSPQLFGFKNMAGPQIYPAVRYVFRNQHIATGYLKYSPVDNKLGFRDFSNRELAIGGAYLYPLKNGHTLNGNIDLANVVLDFPTIKTTMSSTIITIGVGYTL